MEFRFNQPVSEEIFFEKYDLYEEGSVNSILRSISKEISSVEDESVRSYFEDEFFELMKDSLFIPAGRIMANARPFSLMRNYMNCYVIPIGDSMEEIYTALREDALIGKMGGGVGFNISTLRPKGASISKGGESSGPISFLEIFDTSAKAIHTGGNRRGAHICILNVDHPDIEQFITYKQGDKNEKLTQFNISVGITDDFMECVKNNYDWDLKFGGKVYKTIKARYLYDLITTNMYEHNEPGVFFLDTVNNNNNGSYMYDIVSPNPCAEQPLPPYGCCCLGAMKLSSFVEDPFTDKARFNFDKFRKAVPLAVRFLDNVLSTSEYPLERIKEQVLGERRIGLGYTALADTFAMMRMEYGNLDSQILSDQIGRELRDMSYYTSVQLAREKGAFPYYDEMILESGFIQKLPTELKEEIKINGLRNIALNTVAPVGTGSLTIGNNCSSGIEPIFALQYTRTITRADGTKDTQEVLSDAWLNFQATTNENHIPSYFKTASEVSLEESLKIQAIFQQYVDASISKTLQLPDEFTYDQYQELVMKAWQNGLKGLTTYNPNGSLAPILTTKKDKEPGWEEVKILANSKRRPEQLVCDIYEMQVNKQRVVVLIGRDDEDNAPYEVFLTLDKDSVIKLSGAKEGFIKKNGGGKYHLVIEGKTQDRMVLEDITSVFDDDYAIMCRLLSLALRHKIPLQFIVDQLNKTRRFDIFSRAMARVLKKYIGDGEKVISRSEVCPDCKSKLQFIEGCKTCMNCGWSKC